MKPRPTKTPTAAPITVHLTTVGENGLPVSPFCTDAKLPLGDVCISTEGERLESCQRYGVEPCSICSLLFAWLEANAEHSRWSHVSFSTLILARVAVLGTAVRT